MTVDILATTEDTKDWSVYEAPAGDVRACEDDCKNKTLTDMGYMREHTGARVMCSWWQTHVHLYPRDSTACDATQHGPAMGS
jgi:hypothetical protein